MFLSHLSHSALSFFFVMTCPAASRTAISRPAMSRPAVSTDSCVKVNNLVSSKSIETSFHAETSTLPMRFPVMHVVIVLVVGDSHLNEHLMK